MTIQTFIEKAHKGEYLLRHAYVFRGRFVDGLAVYETVLQSPAVLLVPIQEILLDPLAWAAVGKVEGWGEDSYGEEFREGWWCHMHRMIDALTEGRSVEQYLETL